MRDAYKKKRRREYKKKRLLNDWKNGQGSKNNVFNGRRRDKRMNYWLKRLKKKREFKPKQQRLAPGAGRGRFGLDCGICHGQRFPFLPDQTSQRPLTDS